MKNPVPIDGSVFSFRTRPFSEFAPPATDRFAAFKVLASNHQFVVVAVQGGIWNAAPTLSDVSVCGILHVRRFLDTGRPAVWGINIEEWKLSEIDEPVLLGALEVSADEIGLAEKIFNFLPGSVISSMDGASMAAEGEWRWVNDRGALEAEREQVRARAAAQRAAQETRMKNRLRGLTWEKLRSETPFERWTTSPPYPSEQFTREARMAIHRACETLQELGPKPKKTDVRKVLRTLVEWFNRADDEAGGVIETEEREDICAALEEIAFVARQESLANEIDEWRTW
tara:strand:+ start:3087 stop:3941 length:855 start_codon:yes stop_codon:yes gene_type:complete